MADLPDPAAQPELLAIERLEVGFATAGEPDRRQPDRGRPLRVLRDVSLDVRRGEILALVGESGSGKTLTALAVLGLLPPGGRIFGGRILLAGAGDLLALGEKERRKIRGRRIAMIFQDPMSALNPVLTVGFQIAESLRHHQPLTRRQAAVAARRLFELVALSDPGRRYPHQLSGGQLQRVMIAMAIASRPDLLLADEPTTALDVTIQAQVLELLVDLRRRLGLTVLLITHDLGVVAECADRVAVMYAGQIVEQAAIGELFRRPAHPYTRGLLAAVPRLGARAKVAGIAGRIPEPGALPSGCSFHPRCPQVMERCRKGEPELYGVALEGGGAACKKPAFSPHRCRCFLHREGSP